MESTLQISGLSQMKRLSSSVGTAALLHCALRASATGKGRCSCAQRRWSTPRELPGSSRLGDGITAPNTSEGNRGAVLKVALRAKLGV